MRWQVPKVDWQVFESDKDWDDFCKTQLVCSSQDAVNTHQGIQPFKHWEIVFSLVLIVNVGGWWYSQHSALTQHKVGEQCIPFTIPSGSAQDTDVSNISVNQVTDAEIQANRKVLSEFHASVAGQGHFAEPYNYQVKPNP